MKKIFTYLFIGSFLYTYSQLTVSQNPEKKKVILEEFTGKDCPNCPSGHAIGNAMKDADPDNVFLINIHTGGFANGSPNYRTDFGQSLANNAGVTGYPSGTVNRQPYNGANSTSINRAEWAAAGEQIKLQDAYVNVAVEGIVDVVTKELTVNVEAFYTANSPENTNFLNVVLTQDGILGPQSGAGGNAAGIDEATGLYIHNHMLRHVLTGQWGEEITTTSMGTTVSRTFTYTVPDMLGDVEMDVTKLDVVAFITETRDEIINGRGTQVQLDNLPNNLEAQAIAFDVQESSCDGIVEPRFEVRNFGQETITELEIVYSANGGPEFTYNWTGNILSGFDEIIEMPALGYATLDLNEVNISIESVNGGEDEVPDNNALEAVVTNVDEHQTYEIVVELSHDQWGAEVSYQLLDANDDVVSELAIGTFADGAPGTDMRDIALDNFDCYTFILSDSFGDGGASIVISDKATGTVLYTSPGAMSYSTEQTYRFATLDANGGGNGNGDGSSVNPELVEGIFTAEPSIDFSVYPNPATNVVNIDFDGTIESVELINIIGETISKTNSSVVDVNNLPNGIYFIKLEDNLGNRVSQSFVKK